MRPSPGTGALGSPALTHGPRPAVVPAADLTLLDHRLPPGPGCLCGSWTGPTSRETTMTRGVRVAAAGAALAVAAVVLQGSLADASPGPSGPGEGGGQVL